MPRSNKSSSSSSATILTVTLEVEAYNGQTMNRVMLEGAHVGYAFVEGGALKLTNLKMKPLTLAPGEAVADALVHRGHTGGGRSNKPVSWYVTLPGARDIERTTVEDWNGPLGLGVIAPEVVTAVKGRTVGVIGRGQNIIAPSRVDDTNAGEAVDDIIARAVAAGIKAGLEAAQK